MGHRDVLLLLLSCTTLEVCSRAGVPPAGCDGQRCSGHGVCLLTVEGEALCACDPGFHNHGLERCVPDSHGDLGQPPDAATERSLEDASTVHDSAEADQENPDATNGGAFFDEFGAPDLSSYVFYDGTWELVDDALQQTSCEYGSGQLLESVWADVVVEADLRFEQTCATGRNQAALHLRADPTAERCVQFRLYSCTLDLAEKRIGLIALNGVCEGGWLASTSAPALQSGQWYHLRFSALAQDLECTLSGSDIDPPIVVRALHAAYSDGAVGFFSDTQVSFDNLRVTLTEP